MTWKSTQTVVVAQQTPGVSDRHLDIPTSPHLDAVLQKLHDKGHKALIVGGAVRDAMLGEKPKDVDVEVYGTNYDDLADTLKPHGKVNLVGKAFGVVKFTDHDKNDYDFSLPRRDNKTGIGHKDFETEFDPDITPREAASRRDFTFNALAYDPVEHKLHDYFGGEEDLKNKTIRHTSEAFAEDPLRVLRGMQFSARYGMDVHPDTAKLAQSIKHEYPTIPKERVGEEFMKLATKGKEPGRAVDYLQKTGWHENFPALHALHGLAQDPQWHPEGDVATHTAHAMNAAANIADREGLTGDDRATLVFGAMCHDMGKPSTTKFWPWGPHVDVDSDPERVEYLRQHDAIGKPAITSHGHDQAGGPIARQFLDEIGIKPDITNRVVPLVERHMQHLNYEDGISPRTVRRLAERLHPAKIKELGHVMEADHSGRPPLPGGMPEGAQQMLAKASESHVVEKKIEPLIKGRDILPYFDGKPGPHIGEHVKAAYQAQLDGEINTPDEAQAWLRDRMTKTSGLPATPPPEHVPDEAIEMVDPNKLIPFAQDTVDWNDVRKITGPIREPIILTKGKGLRIEDGHHRVYSAAYRCIQVPAAVWNMNERRWEKPSQHIDLNPEPPPKTSAKTRTIRMDLYRSYRAALREADEAGPEGHLATIGRPGQHPADSTTRAVARDYMASQSMPYDDSGEDEFVPVDEARGKRIAEAFEDAPHSPQHPTVVAAYEAFKHETCKQYDHLKSHGYEMTPWAGEGQPYKNSAQFTADVRNNRSIKYFKTVNPDEVSFGAESGGDPKDNPLLEDADRPATDTQGHTYHQTFNDLFRAVHDIYGHAKEGNQTGPRGEENAWRQHARMYSPLARRAMTTETRGQNSFVNFGRHLRRSDGSLPAKGEPDYVDLPDRPYADQKVTLLPPEFSELHHPQDNQRVASQERIGMGAAGDLPDLTYRHVRRRDDWCTDEDHDIHNYLRAWDGKKEVGYMRWAADREGQGPYIEGLTVHEDYQRTGVATEMFRRAKEITPDLQHSYNLSPDARKWVRSMPKNAHKKRIGMATIPHEQLPEDLQGHLRDFAAIPAVAEMADPRRARENCSYVTEDFHRFLRDRGVSSEIWTFKHTKRPDCHVVNRVGEHFIDWTARQYHPDRDFPDVFEDPKDRKFNRNHKWDDAYINEWVKPGYEEPTGYRQHGASKTSARRQIAHRLDSPVFEDAHPTLYHVAPARLREDIRKGGLRSHHPTQTWAFDNLDHAHGWRNMVGKDEPHDIWKVDATVPGHDPDVPGEVGQMPDWEWVGENPHSHILVGTGPEHLNLIHPAESPRQPGKTHLNGKDIDVDAEGFVTKEDGNVGRYEVQEAKLASWRNVRKIAMPRDENWLNEINFEHTTRADSRQTITAWHPGVEMPVGHVNWVDDGDGPYVSDIDVEPEYRRRGLGGELLSRARAKEPTLHHDKYPTPEGKALLDSKGDRAGGPVTASWRDVRNKAVRLRNANLVDIIRFDPDVIAARVQGDHHMYDVVLYRQYPDSWAITMWECSCKWGDWAFKRQITYVGRFCSHALATLYEAHGMEYKTGAVKMAHHVPKIDDPVVNKVRAFVKSRAPLTERGYKTAKNFHSSTSPDEWADGQATLFGGVEMSHGPDVHPEHYAAMMLHELGHHADIFASEDYQPGLEAERAAWDKAKGYAKEVGVPWTDRMESFGKKALQTHIDGGAPEREEKSSPFGPPRPVCPDCKGEGYQRGHEYCDTCGGSGNIDLKDHLTGSWFAGVSHLSGLESENVDYPKNWKPNFSDVGKWQEGTLPTDYVRNIALRHEPSLQSNRGYRGEGQWDAFKDDIKQNGIKHQLLIYVNDPRDTGHPALQIEGHHRLLAAHELGMPEVPVEVRYYGTAHMTKPDVFRERVAMAVTPEFWNKQGPLYHLTSFHNTDQIEQEGLIPHKSSGWYDQWAGEPRKNHVYLFTENPEKLDQSRARVVVDPKQLDHRNIRLDEDFYAHHLWDDDDPGYDRYDDMPYTEDKGAWAERNKVGEDPAESEPAIEETGTLAHHGAIPASAIHGHYDPDGNYHQNPAYRGDMQYPRQKTGMAFRPNRKRYRTDWDELPDKLYHVAPAAAHDSIMEEGLNPTGRTHNLALSENDRDAGGHWNKDYYHGPGSDQYHYRPEGVYTFSSPRVAVDVAENFTRTRNQPHHIYEIDVNSLRAAQRKPAHKTDMIRDPEVFQANWEVPREQRTHDDAEDFWRDMRHEDWGPNGEEVDGRQFVFEKVHPDHIKRVKPYTLKHPEDWDDDDLDDYSEDHPGEDDDDDKRYSFKKMTHEEGSTGPEISDDEELEDPQVHHHVMYHVTPTANRAAIERDGLHTGSFAFDNLGEAKWFHEGRSNPKVEGAEPHDIWQLDTREIHQHPDDVWVEVENKENDEAHILSDPVPPEKMHRLDPHEHARTSALGRGTLVFYGTSQPIKIDVEVARDAQSIQQGLMNRTFLGPRSGMAFVYPYPPSYAGFWMKNTLIPLSVAFWDREGRIIEIKDMQPCTSGDRCPTYECSKPYWGAVEVNLGFFRQWGIGPGTRVELHL